MSKFRLGPLRDLGDVIGALSKTIRAMADHSLDDQRGARICNGLGIMRACLETQVLQSIEDKIEKVARRAIGNAHSYAADERDDEVSRLQ
jgi:hypothetical protein